MAEDRKVYVRVAVRDEEKAAAALRRFGSAGDKSLQGMVKRFDDVGKRAPRSLRLVNGAARELDGTMRGLAMRAGPVGSILAGLGPAGMAAAVGVAAISSAVVGLVRVGEGFERDMFRVDALLKSTGHSAGVTADEIDRLAIKLGDETLTSAPAVRRAAAALLTFKSVAGDAFERTLVLAQDLAAAGMGTLESSVLQLGKALEDPATGLTALRRVGVSFTEAQRDQITAMVEAGQVAEAHGAILDVLAGQVGGAGKGEAQGLTGRFDSLTEAIRRFIEEAAAASGAGSTLGGVIETITQGARNARRDLFPDNAEQLADLQRERAEAVARLNETRRRLAEFGGDNPGLSATALQLEREIAALGEKEDALIAVARAEEQARREARAAAEEGRRKAAEERERARQDEAAAAAAKAAATAHGRAAKAAASELARIREANLTAGLDGIAKLQAERDRDLAKWEQYLADKLVTERQYLAAVAGIEERYRKEKGVLDAAAADKAVEERRKAAEKSTKAALEAIEKQQEEVAATVGRVGDRVAEHLGTTFYDRLAGRNADLWESFKDLALRTVAEVAAELATQQVVVPLVTRVVQGSPGTFGVGRGSSGGGGMPNLPGGAGGDFFGLADRINSFGADVGFSPGIASTMPTGAPLVGANGMLTGGGATSVVPGQVANGSLFGTTSLTSAVGGTMAGFGVGTFVNGLVGGEPGPGMAGSGLGAAAGMMVGGPIGALVGGAAGGLLSGLLFGKKPSVGPNASAAVDLVDGLAVGGGATADNGGDLGAALQGARDLASTINALVAMTGGRLSDLSTVKVGSFDKRGPFVQATDPRALAVLSQYGEPGKATGHGAGTAYYLGEETAEASLRASLATAAFDDLSDTMRQVVEVIQRTKLSVEEMETALGFAGVFDAVVAAERPLSTFQQGMRDLVAAFEEGAEQAAALSLDVGAWAAGTVKAFNRDISDRLLAATDPLAFALTAFERDARARLQAAIEIGADLVEVERLIGLEREQIIRQAAGGMAEQIRQALSGDAVGGLSPLAPAEKLAEAQAEFARLVEAGLAGDAAAGRAALAQRDTVLQLADAVYGSGAGFAAVFAKSGAALRSLEAAFGSTAALGETTSEFVARIDAEIRASGAAPIVLPEPRPMPKPLPQPADDDDGPEAYSTFQAARDAGGDGALIQRRGGLFYVVGHRDADDPGRGRAFGGRVFGAGGPTDDRVPMRLSPGEFVLRASAVRELGLERVQQMNDNPAAWRSRSAGEPGSSRGDWRPVLDRLERIERAIVAGDDVKIGQLERQIGATGQVARGVEAQAREAQAARAVQMARGRLPAPGGRG